LFVVEKDSFLILYIENPSQEVQLAAANKNPYSIKLIENPTQRVKEFLRSKGFNI